MAISARSMGKLEKVKKEVEDECGGKIEVRPFTVDYSKTYDYSNITGQEDIMDNLRIVVNNVGYMKIAPVFRMEP